MSNDVAMPAKLTAISPPRYDASLTKGRCRASKTGEYTIQPTIEPIASPASDSRTRRRSSRRWSRSDIRRSAAGGRRREGATVGSGAGSVVTSGRLLLGLRVAAVVRARHLGLEDLERLCDAAGHLRQLLSAEEHQHHDHQHGDVPGFQTISEHRHPLFGATAIVSRTTRPPAGQRLCASQRSYVPECTRRRRSFRSCRSLRSAMRRARASTGSCDSPGCTTNGCLLYTSDAADDLLCVDLGGR